MTAISTLQIQRAQPTEAALIALLARVSFRQAFASAWNNEAVLSQYLRTTFAVSKLQLSLAKTENVYWIARLEDLPIGYAKLKRNCPHAALPEPGQAQLQKIYLLHEFSGQGIGAELLKATEQFARQEHISALWLAVWAGNVGGLRFYQRHGWRQRSHYHYQFQSREFEYAVMAKDITGEP